MKKIYVILFIVFISTIKISIAQTDTVKNNLPNVYIDCNECDMEYTKKQVDFVNYVRERRAADLHILVTGSETGSGGFTAILLFYGQNKFAGKNDTLTFSVKPNTAEEIIKEKFVKVLKLGILKYLTNTNMLDNVSINFKTDKKNQITETQDPWKYWVFRIASHAWYNGESSYKHLSLYDHISANKITEKFKFEFYIGNNYNESHYMYDNNDIVGINNNYWLQNKTVFSLTDHWSAGFSSGASSSTYSNILIAGNVMPAIEYDVFPYSKSTIKQFRIMYRVGPAYKNYIDTTVFNKTEEILFRNDLLIGYATNKKWGNIEFKFIGGTYLHDVSLNSVSFSTDLSINILKGLSFNLSGQVSFIHDQISLPKDEASLENVLIRTQQLPTTFNYYTSVGLSYTFGSIYNNVVNPRFDD